MFGPKIHCVVVVGAQWGDEGKGKIVDVLAERADLVVRYQGGANAGHTVHTTAGEFVLHQIPSGILQGAVCIVGNGVVLDPETLFTELDALTSRGIRTEHKLYVSERAHLTLPFHKLLDRAREQREKIGTTGRGIGPTYEDKYGRRGIRVGDLRNLGRAKELVCGRVEAANAFLGLLGSAERADAGEHIALLERLAPRLLPLAVDAGRVVWEALERGESVLLEGAQGALLDVDHGTYPYVTSSNTTAGGAAVGAGIGPTAIDAVLGVVKAYTTRVGNGPLRGARQRPHRPRRHQARRARLVLGDSGVCRLPLRRRVTRLDARRGGAPRARRAGVRDAARLAEVAQPCASAGGPTASRQGLPGPAPGPCTRTHPIRERGYASRSDHRSDVTVAR